MTQRTPDPFAADPWLAERPRRSGRWPRWVIVWVVGCGSLVGLAFAGLLALGAAISMGHMPDSKALSEKDVPAATLGWLREQGLVEPGERVRYFYASGTWRLDEGGCFFTDRRVVDYWPGETEGVGIESVSAPLADVVVIEPTWSEHWWDDSWIFIEAADWTELELCVSAEGEGDRDFERKLREACRVARAQSNAGFAADGTMDLERQIEILSEFGIAMPEGVTLAELCAGYGRPHFEERPFDRLLEAAGGTGGDVLRRRNPSVDVCLFEFDDVAQNYRWLATRLRDLADGALPIESISHEIDPVSGEGVLHFELDGRREAWPTDVEEESTERMVVYRFAALLANDDHESRFAGAWTEDESALIIVCVSDDQLVDLRRRTGLDFDGLE